MRSIIGHFGYFIVSKWNSLEGKCIEMEQFWCGNRWYLWLFVGVVLVVYG